MSQRADESSEARADASGPPEGLFALGGDPDGIKTLTLVRELTHEEQDATWAAEATFARLTLQSPYEDLRCTYRELADVLANAKPTRVADVFRYAATVRRLFRHWLNDFRSFDDRTSKWVSAKFGKEHRAYECFKKALSAEYDANFAYRLAATLRNASTHEADMLNHQWWHLTKGPDGQSISRPILAIDGPRLATDISSLKPAVGKELGNVTEGLIDPAALLDAAMRSCTRCHLTLVHELWDDLQPHRDLVTRLHEEAAQAGGAGAMFVDLETFDPQEGIIDHRYNALHLLEGASHLRDEGDRIRDLDVLTVKPTDLLLKI